MSRATALPCMRLPAPARLPTCQGAGKGEPIGRGAEQAAVGVKPGRHHTLQEFFHQPPHVNACLLQALLIDKGDAQAGLDRAAQAGQLQARKPKQTFTGQLHGIIFATITAVG